MNGFAVVEIPGFLADLAGDAALSTAIIALHALAPK